MPIPALPPPSALIEQGRPAKAPARPLPLAEAEAEALAAYDERKPFPELRVAPRHQPALAWLRQAFEGRPSKNPFPPKSPEGREAQGMLDLLGAPEDPGAEGLTALSLKRAGTRLALWRWMQARSRGAGLDPLLRRKVEDRLMAREEPDLVAAYGLRHALCFALAEGDEGRFADLKAHHAEQEPTLFQGIQSLLGMLGSPLPQSRLWALPELAYRDVSPGELGRRIWVQPYEGSFPALPPGTLWFVPTQGGHSTPATTDLAGPDEPEGRALAEELRKAGRAAWLVTERGPWESSALAFFPILLDFEGSGALQRVRMGDAAPPAP